MTLRAWPMLAAALSLGACSGDKDSPAGGTGDPGTTTTTGTTDTAQADGWAPVLEDDDRGAFLSVWGPSADDVWIVGGQPETGVVLRGSGDTFTEQPLPEGTPLLNWVHGTAEDDVWVGGLAGTLLHWNGTDWTDHTLEIEEAIWGVYARSATEVYAVGGDSAYGGSTAVAQAFDGTTWQALAIPPELDGLENLFKVHDDGTDIWMVGYRGAAMRGSAAGGFVAAPTGTSADLVTANRSPGEGPMVVVGGRGTGVVFEPDGSGGLTQVATAIAGLSGVQVFPSGEAVVVGELGYIGRYTVGSGTVVDDDVLTQDVLHAAWGTAGDSVYAVGGNLYTTEDFFHGVVLRGPAPE